MPTSPPSRCTTPTCHALATRAGRCDEHQRPAWQTRSQHWDQIPRRRWARLRRQQLAREPHCRTCGADATEVDHIIPISEGGAIWDPRNHQSLCEPHHSAKSRAEAARANRRRAGQRRRGA